MHVEAVGSNGSAHRHYDESVENVCKRRMVAQLNILNKPIAKANTINVSPITAAKAAQSSARWPGPNDRHGREKNPPPFSPSGSSLSA